MNRIRLVAVLAAIVAAAPAAAAGADPCHMLTKERMVVITGLTPDSAGMLCTVTGGTRQCQPVRADRAGVVAAEAGSAVTGLSWFTPASGLGCSAAPIVETDETRALVIQLVSLFAAFISGFGAVLIPIWLGRRERSREAAAAWAVDYETRLRGFEVDPTVDPNPRPLPLLARKEMRRLGQIVTLAWRTLEHAGYAKASSDDERKVLVKPILDALAGVQAQA